MQKFSVIIKQEIEVELDAEKFDENFMAEFRESFFPFFDTEDHARHIAQMCARGVHDFYPTEFVEGYGRVSDMGIKADAVDFEVLGVVPVAARQKGGDA